MAHKKISNIRKEGPYNTTKSNRKIFLWATLVVILLITLLKTRFVVTEVVFSVYKALDPSFLVGDVYSDSRAGYHSQYYYSILLAFLVSLTGFSVEIITSLFGTFSKLLTLFAVFYAGKKLSNGSNEIGILTAMISLLSLAALGGWSLLLNYARPWSFVHAFLILGITHMLLGRIRSASTIIGIGSIFHPLLGGVVWGITFCASYLDVLISSDKKISIKKIFDKTHLQSLLIFIALYSLNLVPALLALSSSSLPPQTFIDLVAHFRHPMHYVPSSWPLMAFIEFGAIMATAILLLTKTTFDKNILRKGGLLSIFIILLMATGYVFVELIPLKIATMIIGFRYSLILYFFFTIIFSVFLMREVFKKSMYWSLLFLISYFVVSNANLLLITTISYLYFRSPLTRYSLAAVHGFFFVVNFDLSSLAYLLIIISWFILIKPPFNITVKTRERLLKGATALLVFLLFIFSYALPNITNTLQKEEHEIAIAAKELTPLESHLMIPFGLEIIRTTGKRKLFAGIEFPFLEEEYMVEWSTRAKLIWGENAFEELNKRHFDANYRNITDEKLRFIHQEYNVTHAVLFTETNTSLPTIYYNKKYRLVYLGEEQKRE